MKTPILEALTDTPPTPTRYAERMTVFLGDKRVENKLSLDNSMLEDELTIRVPSGTKKINLRIDQNQRYVYDFSAQVDDQNCVKVKLSQILRYVPFNRNTTLTITGSGRKNSRKKLQLYRSTAGITPDPGRAQKSILPLYQQIARDLVAGKPLVITANVVLWDASFNGRRRFPITDGNDPQHNLYWGAGYGMYHAFKKLFGWRLVGEEKDKMAVFKKVFTPNAFWQERGVKKPFEMYVVFNLYRSNDIVEGYRDFAQNLFGNRAQRITLKDGRVIEAGSQSRIVGYVGHMTLQGKKAIKAVRNSQSTNSSEAKGVFMTSCLSAPIFSREVLDENNFGLLFTTSLLAPEAYVQNALFDAIARGARGDKISRGVASAYADYHDNYPGRVFITSESPRIEDFSSPYEGDSDKDGIDNRIDPEPDKVNQFERNGDSMIITTSSGKRIVISLEKETYFETP